MASEVEGEVEVCPVLHTRTPLAAVVASRNFCPVPGSAFSGGATRCVYAKLVRATSLELEAPCHETFHVI